MIKLTTPKLISIDLDGTLVDSVPDLAWAVDKSLEAMGYPARGIDNIRDWVGNGAAMLLQRALGNGDENAVKDEQTLADARRHFDHFYGSHFAVDTRLYDGVLDALDWLSQQQIQLALITNKPIAFTEPMLQQLKLAHYFQYTLGGDSLAKSKPNPQPLLHVATAAGVSPAHCLHIGDSVTDVSAAKNAGFASVAVSFGYNHGQPIAASEPDVVIDHWHELSGFFS